MLRAAVMVVPWLAVLVAATACTGSEDSPEIAGCVPGNGSFGARCCGAEAEECGAELFCQKGQCTKPCDGGPECDGLAVDGGPRPCSNGFCTPPPLPVSGGAGDGTGW